MSVSSSVLSSRLPGLLPPRVPLPRVFCLVSGHDDLGLLPELLAVGVAGFQVRDKEISPDRLARLVARVLDSVGDAATVVVNDHLDVALATQAHGVHLGADDLPVRVARDRAPGLLIGATCRSRADVERAAADGADLAGFGPVGVSGSKSGLPDPLGVDAVADAAGFLPLLAIGGIDLALARRVRAAGAHGVAVIGAIWRQPDPVASARELVEAVD